jgi:phosphoserine phosphatase
MMRRRWFRGPDLSPLAAAILALALILPSPGFAEDPLPSWRDGASKAAIVEFVAAVTAEGGQDFVPERDRLAVFDNDGTLWSEQPIYVQFAFVLDRIRELSPAHPEWKETEPFKSVLAGNIKNVMAQGEKGVAKLLAATHAGMDTDAFSDIVLTWLTSARHPKYARPYDSLVYQPMLELLAYLRANGFRTYIVSGGGADFMRPWAEKSYGVPPDQVIGSMIDLKYEVRDGKPVLMREPGIDFVDDGPGKPVGIYRQIGERPIAAFGNSDGDYQMLEWVTAGEGRRLGMIVHHTDELRETAYDRDSPVGKLDTALDDAAAKGWHVIDMKADWLAVFPAWPPQ